MLRVLDLFSGIGGFSLGLERTGGFETVAFCEIEEYPRKVLAKHWPDVPIYTDVQELTGDRLRADGIAVDVITGGFPCQDLSVAGKQAGIHGERSGLFDHIIRLAGDLRPRYIILENVAALLTGDSGGWARHVFGELAEIGFDAEWHVIPAGNPNGLSVGAPHRRERVWIVAYPGHHATPTTEVPGSIAPRGNGYAERPESPGEPAGLRPPGEHGDVADATGKRGCSGNTGGQYAKDARQSSGDTRRNTGGMGEGQFEPDLGRAFDGVSDRLSGGRIDGQASEDSSAKEMRALRTSDGAETVQRETGGLWGVHAARLLQSGLHGERLCIRCTVRTAVNEAGAGFSDERVRELWNIAETTGASHRPEPSEQLRREYPDLVHQLSCRPPSPCASCWFDGSWEDGIARVATGVPDRTHKLKGLGNSVVPQIPQIIGMAILERECND